MLGQLAQQLGINSTIFIMFGLVVGTYAILYPLILRKLTDTIVERDARTHGRIAQVAELKVKVEELRFEYQQEIQKARTLAAQVFDVIRAKATEEYKKTVSAARERANDQIKKSRESTEAQLRQEFAKIKGQVPELAAAVVQKLVQTNSASRAQKDAHV